MMFMLFKCQEISLLVKPELAGTITSLFNWQSEDNQQQIQNQDAIFKKQKEIIDKITQCPNVSNLKYLGKFQSDDFSPPYFDVEDFHLIKTLEK